MIVYVGQRLPDFEVDLLFVIPNSGEFCQDEMLATSIIDEAACRDYRIAVVRTRDPEIIEKGDLVFDIEGCELEHHSLCRENGQKYVSVASIWKEHGETVVVNILADQYVKAVVSNNVIKEYIESVDSDNALKENYKTVAKEIYEEVIIPAADGKCNIFSFIDCYNPTWLDGSNYIKNFSEALNIFSEIFCRLIWSKIVDVFSRNKIDFSKIDSGTIEIPSRRFQWKDLLIGYNFVESDPEKKVYFVIFKDTYDDTWEARIVPFMQWERNQPTSFPKEWIGKTGFELVNVSGVEEAVMCNKDSARARNKEGIIKMCKIAQGIPV